MKNLLITSIFSILFSFCVPWDFKLTPKFETETYPESTAYDRAVRRIMRSNKQTLYAGASRVDITPPKKKWVYMAGYNIGRRSTGVLDPIYAKCAFLSNGEESVLFVSLDLIGYFYDDIVEVRGMISKDKKLSNQIVISSVHNHEGPDTMGLWGPGPFSIFPVKNGRDPYYDKWLKKKIIECAFGAVQDSKPAKLRFAKTEVPEGYQENMRREGYKENTMYLLRADDFTGKSIFTLANYPIHIEALDESNHLISADILGAMYKYYEDNQDGILLFTQGSLGGMVVPKISKWAKQSEKIKFKDIVGRQLAISALKGLESNFVEAKEPVVIEHKYKIVSLPVENKDFELAYKIGILKREIKEGKLVTEIHFVRIGEAIFVTIPGESLPEVGFEINKIIPSDFKFKINLGMDEIGYILPESYWADPLYDYEKSMSLGPKTADIIFNTIKDLIENK